MSGEGEALIVGAIEGLRLDMNSRFGELRTDLTQRIDAVVEATGKVADDHENRLRETESLIAKGKGVMMVLGGLIGVDGLAHAKTAWISLMK